MTIRNLARTRPLLFFFFLAYLLAWVSWLPLVLSQTGLGYVPVKIPMAYTVVGSYAPLAAAVLTHWLATGNIKLFRYRVVWRWLLLGLLVGWALVVVAFVLAPSAVLSKPPLRAWDWKAFALYPAGIVHSIFLAAGPLGEEPGWRGFALPRLQQRHGPAVASLILGVLWFGWHLPLFLLPAWTSSPLYIYALLVVSFSFLMTFAYNLSGRNVVVAIVLHAAFNCSPVVLGGFLANTTTKDGVSFEPVLALCFMAVAVALTVVTGGKLGKRVTATDMADSHP